MAICRTYIFASRRQYAGSREYMCEIIATSSGAYILPNNLPQFGILSSLCAICQSREYMCVRLLAFSTTSSVALHTTPPRQFSQFCNMQYMQYANLTLLALSTTSAAYLHNFAASSYCSVDICAHPNNSSSQSWKKLLEYKNPFKLSALRRRIK